MAKNKKKKRGQADFLALGDILGNFEMQEEDKYVSREFQQYGYELAEELNDLKHKSLYIKLAKEENRGLLETAKNFVKDASNARSPGKLFMWKLGELKKVSKEGAKKNENK